MKADIPAAIKQKKSTLISSHPAQPASQKTKKSSASYMTAARQRLRDEGFVPREAWILPQNTTMFRRLEMLCRKTLDANMLPLTLEKMMSVNEAWTAEALSVALTNKLAGQNIEVKLHGGLTPSIMVTMGEYGDLPVFIAASGGQILAESFLFPVDCVADENQLNRTILESRKMFTLSSISIQKDAEGRDWYSMYGNLASDSSLDNVITEIETLAANVISCAEIFKSFVNK